LKDLIEHFKTLIRKFCTENEINRYIDYVQDLVKSYNLRKHRMIGMAPYEAEMNPQAALIINNIISKQEKLIKKQQPNLTVGSYVRISKTKDRFTRGYDMQTQREIFKIKSINTKMKKPLYYLSDYNGEEDIKGGFYRFQLTPVDLNRFRIEKILRRKKDRHGRNMVLVKWTRFITIPIINGFSKTK